MYRPPRAIKNSVSITSIPSATPNESDTMTKTLDDDEIVHRELNTDREEPAVAVAEIVAELEGKHADELTTTYACIDGMIRSCIRIRRHQRQMTVEFTYSGYRITIEQSGTAEFVKVT